MSLWFLPTIFAALAIGIANLCIWLDAQVGASIGVRYDLVSDPATAANFAGTIAAATLAFVAVVFATTLSPSSWPPASTPLAPYVSLFDPA
jgi:uncharacterized membrane protein